MNLRQINIIDGLNVFEVPITMITEKNHGYEGEGLEEYDIYTTKPSIEENGIQTPLVLYKLENELFGICDGWHRWKISLEIGLQVVPAVIFESLKDCRPTPNIRW